MIDKEERVLRQNVDEVKHKAESLEEMKLYNAMRGGIMQGKKREKRRSYFYGMGVVIAAAAAALFLFSINDAPGTEVAEQSPPSYTATTKSWTDSAKFSRASMRDRSFQSILDRNLIKPVYQSVEKNGLRVEVMGAVADTRKLFILYSVHNNTDQTVSHADFSLDFGAFEAASIGASLEITAHSSQINAGQTSYFIYTNNLSPTVDYPKEVTWNVMLYQTSGKGLQTNLSIPFELDPDMFKEQTRTLHPESNLIVDGQTIKVNQVLYTPLNTYVDLEFEKNNDKQVFSLIEPVLIVKSAGKTVKSYYPGIITADNSEVYSDRSKSTLYFKNTQDGQPDAATLKTFGIAALDKDQMKIKVDLSKKQMIEAPGTDLSIIKSEEGAEAGKILFRQTFNKVPLNSIISMRLSDTFTDANGQSHKTAGENGQISRSSSNKESTAVDQYLYNFGKEAAEYPQPLTLTIERYWNPIMDTQTVEFSSQK
ncbi:hypothetical protein NST07_16200 [Paenibacillus sp. FSL L8-0340]|uniref:hypothetical protein n=1 Tax=Paenibacillus sp. FSL L8-0340 TaxID=2954685 RepID=UPI0031581357